MSQITTGQIRRVQKYSRFARAICSTLLVLLVVSVGFVFWSILSAPGTDGVRFMVGYHTITANHVEGFALKTWLLVMVLLGLLTAAVIIWLMRALFGNLARGEIFSATNVLHIRRLAYMIVVIGALRIAVPMLNGVFIANGIIDGAHIAILPSVQVPGIFTPFAVAALIFLASWIMQVGLGVSEEANELRRDAELVV